MAVETGFLNISLQASFDARASTKSGTTLANPVDGSGQFMAVYLSTSSAHTMIVPTTGVTTPFFGVLQDKPGIGYPGAVKVIGESKCIATTGGGIDPGMMLSPSTTPLGTFKAYSSAAGTRVVAQAMESAASGQIFSAWLFGPGGGGPNGA